MKDFVNHSNEGDKRKKEKLEKGRNVIENEWVL